MLGCQDFCGHYEWTFHYLRRRWGQAAIIRYWAEAIGGESQRHYADAVLKNGLRGLYDQYAATGEDEHCDWMYTFDESKNFLRCDMRECPSNGFLTKNDLNADEDYCDHCQNWEIPLMKSVGIEVVENEHNHCGQCWTVYRMAVRPQEPIDVPCDIRKDPRWRHGFVHRWESDHRIPLLPTVSDSHDSCDVLTAWFRKANAAIPQEATSCAEQAAGVSPTIAALESDTKYNMPQHHPNEPLAVLIGCPPADLAATADRYNTTAAARRPLLLHSYLPSVPFIDFVSADLPRPLPVLPFLIRNGIYTHRPGGPHPTTEDLLDLLARALDAPPLHR
jgi:hypothetical protein